MDLAKASASYGLVRATGERVGATRTWMMDLALGANPPLAKVIEFQHYVTDVLFQIPDHVESLCKEFGFREALSAIAVSRDRVLIGVLENANHEEYRRIVRAFIRDNYPEQDPDPEEKSVSSTFEEFYDNFLEAVIQFATRVEILELRRYARFLWDKRELLDLQKLLQEHGELAYEALLRSKNVVSTLMPSKGGYCSESACAGVAAACKQVFDATAGDHAVKKSLGTIDNLWRIIDTKARELGISFNCPNLLPGACTLGEFDCSASENYFVELVYSALPAIIRINRDTGMNELLKGLIECRTEVVQLLAPDFSIERQLKSILKKGQK